MLALYCLCVRSSEEALGWGLLGCGLFMYRNEMLESPVFKMWNESGTNRGRIGDSVRVRICSPPDVEAPNSHNTTSGI
jgi:hypothetical protein